MVNVNVLCNAVERHRTTGLHLPICHADMMHRDIGLDGQGDKRPCGEGSREMEREGERETSRAITTLERSSVSGTVK